MKIFAKGSQKYATEVLYEANDTLYFDEARIRQVKQADIKKLMPSQVVVLANSAYFAVDSIAVDGSEVVVGETTYSIAE